MSKRFANPHQKRIYRTTFHFLLWQLGYYKEPPPIPFPEGFTYPNPQEPIDENKPQVTWVNHSTFWIEAFGKGILFDPIWNHRCSPVPFFGPKRLFKAKPSFQGISNVDFVVISHNHYDHLDAKSIEIFHKLHPKIVWIVPFGVKKWFTRFFPTIHQDLIVELKWWEQLSIDSITFTSVPAQHFSGRWLLDRNKSLWMGCVVRFAENKQVYFAGDTGYNQLDFKEIGNRLGPMDLSLLPIGVYLPRKFMKAVHVNPHESTLIHQDVLSKLSVGGHWGTFRLSSEMIERPPFDLYCALEKKQIDPLKFRVLKPGQKLNW